jgi:hypothetical protein
VDSHPITTEQTSEQAFNQKAWNYLITVCQDLAFTVLTTATMSNTHIWWLALLNEYHTNVIDSLVDIKLEFRKCKLKLDTEEPSSWIGRLKLINKRLAQINVIYKKNDYNLTSHIFADLLQKMCMVTTAIVGTS